jgi:hypothetical protein
MFKARGQATVEYLFVLVFMILFSAKVLTRFNDFFRDSIGNLAHVLSQYLIVGVCPTQCFYGSYKNFHKGGQ